MSTAPEAREARRHRVDRRTLLGLAGGAVAGAATSAMSSASASPLPVVWTPVALPTPAPATEGMVDVGGAKLWYWDTGGTGEPVIFMHAGSQSGAGWGYQQPVFTAAGFRCIGYSRRGHYRSEGGSPRDPGMACEDLLKLVDHLNLERVHLVSIALGAFYALDFTLIAPGRVRSLSITSSYLGIDESEQDYFEANKRLRPKEFEALPVEVKELHPSYRVGNPQGTAAWIQLAKGAREGPIIWQKRPYPMTWSRLESIRHPILLMTGDGDLYTPPALMRMQAAHMRNPEIHVIPEAGHAGNWEQPTFFNRSVLDFLRRH